MQSTWIATGGLLAAILFGSDRATRSDEHDGPDGRALFLENCARCHGEEGDGQGITELDRPARSFKDGGFSYGNTVPAIVRTITNGIPGTPMPAFDASTTPAQRRALADFVLSLGPPGVHVDPAATVLVVEDRPLVVRGFLPPIASGAEEHPRGLLLGTLAGLTFEYRVDDVRLLGVRAGEFVERRDWAGRGGDPLRPLGQVVFLIEGGTPRPMFRQATASEHGNDGAGDLRARLRATWVKGPRIGLRYSLHKASQVRGAIDEEVEALGTSLASGFRRSLVWSGPAPSAEVFLDIDTLEADATILTPATGSGDGQSALAVRRPDGTVDFFLTHGTKSDGSLEPQADLFLRPLPDGRAQLEAHLPAQGTAPLVLSVLSGTTFDSNSLRVIARELAQ